MLQILVSDQSHTVAYSLLLINLLPSLIAFVYSGVQVLDHDEKNVSVLVQRALLYENMEKYKLGAEDLRIVMKLDPTNRVARSTIHRLTKMAG